MARPFALVPLLAALLLAALPPATAEPCAPACGSVEITTTCAATVVTAEGASSDATTVWTLVVSYQPPWGSSTTVTRSDTGAAFAYQDTFGPLGFISVSLYADGELLDMQSVWCD